MTECERIIKEGILPESFFKPETICDFYVDETRKKIWAVEIDLLRKFDTVCRQHGLRYYIGYGGLLGIVRHKGFIPWDDDVDVMMFREDYEKFIKISKLDFQYPYELQLPKENGYYYTFARVRNSNTTAFPEVFKYQPYNHGMYLDIFPMDNVQLYDVPEIFEIQKSLMIECSTYMRRSHPNLTAKDKERIANTPFRNPDDIYDEFLKNATLHNNEDTEYVCTYVFAPYGWKKVTWPRRFFDEPNEFNFYGINVWIPKNAEEILQIQYGNYKEFPPVEKRGEWHSDILVDPDKPYKEVLRTLLMEEKKI